MKRQLTLTEAKNEIQSLETFVQIVENYEPKTLQEEIYKFYAITGSIPKTAALINEKRVQNMLTPIDTVLVTEAIKSKPIDQLHRIIRSGYMTKTRHMRKK
ncbi:hypothetical protein FQV26_10410 [Planococcus sp. CPCC 101016]|uniref:hypothetical protein n=1 Tax=Planococcus sp. CPCC 101016 TaxID=2599617 RepID=UPI0011B453F7|nr:hypothetical protein [Planococcus sp. CPCC 101016]TWT08196.1 hypothetical protein FQV26_10410 [Planococcus sp. CPCC 101016]